MGNIPVLFCDVNQIGGEDNDENDLDETSLRNAKYLEFVKEGGVSGLYKCGFEYRKIYCTPQCNTSETHCDACMTSLFHVESGNKITSYNWKIYSKDTIMYGHVAKLCQEITQDRIQSQYGMYFHQIPHDMKKYPLLHMLVSSQLRQPNDINNNINNKEDDAPIFLVLPGKGVSRAGILSTKHLVESSMEQGSANCHIEQAQRKRGYNVVLMDSNAWGRHVKGECLHTSLSYFVKTFLTTSNMNKRKIYILAHSASGGHLVRYLMKEQYAIHNSTSAQKQTTHQTKLFDHIQAIAFTDSTHNIQWLKNSSKDINKSSIYEPLSEFLQSDKCVYIKYNSEHPSDTFIDHKERLAGENYYCQKNTHSKTSSMTTAQYYHKRRFGNIPTVWAGTTDHSAMCWVARHYIWEFFDRHSIPKQESHIIQKKEPINSPKKFLQQKIPLAKTIPETSYMDLYHYKKTNNTNHSLYETSRYHFTKSETSTSSTSSITVGSL